MAQAEGDQPAAERLHLIDRQVALVVWEREALRTATIGLYPPIAGKRADGSPAREEQQRQKWLWPFAARHRQSGGIVGHADAIGGEAEFAGIAAAGCGRC